MTEYVRRYVPCRNALCWNVVFRWDGPYCSSVCKASWCHANARTPTNGLINPPIVHPAGAIPPEVERAMTEQIQQRESAASIAAWVERQGLPPLTELQRAMLEAKAPPHTDATMNVAIAPGHAVIVRSEGTELLEMKEGATFTRGRLTQWLRGWFG